MAVIKLSEKAFQSLPWVLKHSYHVHFIFTCVGPKSTTRLNWIVWPCSPLPRVSRPCAQLSTGTISLRQAGAARTSWFRRPDLIQHDLLSSLTLRIILNFVSDVLKSFSPLKIGVLRKSRSSSARFLMLPFSSISSCTICIVRIASVSTAALLIYL